MPLIPAPGYLLVTPLTPGADASVALADNYGYGWVVARSPGDSVGPWLHANVYYDSELGQTRMVGPGVLLVPMSCLLGWDGEPEPDDQIGRRAVEQRRALLVISRALGQMGFEPDDIAKEAVSRIRDLRGFQARRVEALAAIPARVLGEQGELLRSEALNRIALAFGCDLESDSGDRHWASGVADEVIDAVSALREDAAQAITNWSVVEAALYGADANRPPSWTTAETAASAAERITANDAALAEIWAAVMGSAPPVEVGLGSLAARVKLAFARAEASESEEPLLSEDEQNELTHAASLYDGPLGRRLDVLVAFASAGEFSSQKEAGRRLRELGAMALVASRRTGDEDSPWGRLFVADRDLSDAEWHALAVLHESKGLWVQLGEQTHGVPPLVEGGGHMSAIAKLTRAGLAEWSSHPREDCAGDQPWDSPAGARITALGAMLARRVKLRVEDPTERAGGASHALATAAETLGSLDSRRDGALAALRTISLHLRGGDAMTVTIDQLTTDVCAALDEWQKQDIRREAHDTEVAEWAKALSAIATQVYGRKGFASAKTLAADTVARLKAADTVARARGAAGQMTRLTNMAGAVPGGGSGLDVQTFAGSHGVGGASGGSRTASLSDVAATVEAFAGSSSTEDNVSLVRRLRSGFEQVIAEPPMSGLLRTVGAMAIVLATRLAAEPIVCPVGSAAWGALLDDILATRDWRGTGGPGWIPPLSSIGRRLLAAADAIDLADPTIEEPEA